MKVPAPENQAKKNTESPDSDVQEGKSMMPPPFQLMAGAEETPPDEAPAQMKFNGAGGAVSLGGTDINDRNRDKNLFKPIGNAPHNKNADNNRKIGKSPDVDLGYGKSVGVENEGSLYDFGNGVELGKARGKIGAHVNTTEGGFEAGASAEGSLSAAEYNWNLPLGPYEIPLFGEKTAIDLILSVRAFVGVEGKANLEANINKIQKTKNPLDVSVKNLKMGVEGQVEVFAGAKIEGGVEAHYRWHKKNEQEYIGKIKDNAGHIIDAISGINGWVGEWLQKMPLEDSAELLASFIFGLGSPGTVDLADVEAGAWGAAGVALKASGGLRLTRGKFHFHAKAGVAWGLGFGGNIAIGLDMLEGVLFGLVAGGELLHEVIPRLKELISWKNVLHLGSLAMEKAGDLFGGDDDETATAAPAPATEARKKVKTAPDAFVGPVRPGPENSFVGPMPNK